jgi:hypothetical protein
MDPSRLHRFALDPLKELTERAGELANAQGRDIVAIYRVGVRSAAAAAIPTGVGFEDVWNQGRPAIFLKMESSTRTVFSISRDAKERVAAGRIRFRFRDRFGERIGHGARHRVGCAQLKFREHGFPGTT